jgi:hypothetical protein
MIPEFQGRNLVIATMHGKDRVMRSLLEQKLGVKVHVTKFLNTDRLGTFSGEVDRIGPAESTARRKCEMALAETGFDLAVASEGSFGPHPMLFGVPINEEWVLLYDRLLNITCTGKSISTETNFSHTAVKDIDALTSFANAVQFPSHAIILKDGQENATEIVKGVTDYSQLISEFNRLRQHKDVIYAETDMRAMVNPSRMKVIRQATEQMLNTLILRCPECQALNFGISDIEYGLPCSACDFPTRSILAHRHSCARCGFQERKLFPKNKEKEDPRFCDYCNP